MKDHYTQDQRFEQLTSLEQGEYSGCTFIACDFGERDLSHIIFTECIFQDCNLSLMQTHKTAFREVTFRNCKMLGVRFDTCNAFSLSFSFESCQLDHASFYRLKIKETVFRNCRLKETDFAESELTGSVFDNCDLSLAAFDRTILEKADLRTSYHFSIDPETNRIARARFSLQNVAGLLEKFDIVIE